MLIKGYPAEGFVEITAKDLQCHSVHILTDIRIVQAIFFCGFSQGSGTACVCSNFVDSFEVAMRNLYIPFYALSPLLTLPT